MRRCASGINSTPKKKKKKKKNEGEEKIMENKKFDAGAKVIEELKRNNVDTYSAYVGFLSLIRHSLAESQTDIYGSDPFDYLFQCLLVISEDTSKNLSKALHNYAKSNGYEIES